MLVRISLSASVAVTINSSWAIIASSLISYLLLYPLRIGTLSLTSVILIISLTVAISANLMMCSSY